jgi:ABC-2 type transport system permease protein
VKSYSQLRAMFSLTRASLRAISRSPSALVFSVAFPLIFIVVFGFIGGGGISIRVALENPADTSHFLIKSGLAANPSVKIITELSKEEALADVARGRLTAVLRIDTVRAQNGTLRSSIATTTSSAAMDKYPILRSQLAEIIRRADEIAFPERETIATLEKPVEIPGREYTTIDFILPGQLGFSLLSSGVFGVAFIFFSLRNTLVLKRFFATPINRGYIVMGEALSRVVFQMLTAVVILTMGYFVFGYTLVNGLRTFAELLVLSFIGLVVFMGFGFVVSGLSKNESTIPAFGNLITLPQFLLGGTFFSIEAFPKWLQPISHALPLTYLNKAMRSVAFEGQSLWAVRTEIGILLLWGIVIYAIAIKVFRWE